MALGKTLAVWVAVLSVLLGASFVAVQRFGMPHRDSSLPPLDELSSINSLDQVVRTFAHPFPRAGLYVGVRGTALRIAQQHGGGCVFYNPIHLTDEVRQSLQEWCSPSSSTGGAEGSASSGGGVRFIVVPSDVHHVYLDEFVTAYPGAALVASETIASKHSNLTIQYVLADPMNLPAVPWGPELVLVFAKPYLHEEILLMHRPSRTLCVADMVWNMPSTEAYKRVQVSPSERDAPLQRLVDSVTPSTRVHRGLVALSAGVRPSAQLRNIMRPVFEEYKPERIIVQHGDVIMENGTAMLRDAWSWTGFPEDEEKAKKE